MVLVMQTLTQDADLPLVHAIADGDTAALNELYTRHGLSLFRYLTSRLDDRQLAEEVLQDVMLAVWQGAARFREESTVLTWLFAITQRQLFKAYRRRPSLTLPLDEPLLEGSSNPLHLRLERMARTEALEDAIGQLSCIQRQAIELVFYYGLSGQEAADHLQIPLNTLKSHLFRARTRLRNLLEKEEIR